MARFVSFLVLVLTAGIAVAGSEAEDRGRLSLAWDAHDSGLFEEALGYLDAVTSTSPLATRTAWLRAECRYDLGQFSQAVDALLTPAAAGLPGRDELLLDVYWDQVGEATARGAYAEALEVLQGARRELPRRTELVALESATRFRQEVARAVKQGGDGRVAVLSGAPPAGDGVWVRVIPWQEAATWVPQTTAKDWLPLQFHRLRDAGRVLWLRVRAAELARELTRAATEAGVEVKPVAQGWNLRSGTEQLLVGREEWFFRAATEGLGSAGAAQFAVLEAVHEIAGRAALRTWLEANPGTLQLTRDSGGEWLRHPHTGRSFFLDLGQWAALFAESPEEWSEFWRELTVELGRPPRPFRCFCGRPSTLREVLVQEPGERLVLENGEEFVVVAVAMCPLHLRYVDQALLEEWGVEVAAVVSRAWDDARDNPWQLGFGRGEVGGVPYLFLEGEGVASLVRTPELLLGALERADGYGVRGKGVRIHAPSPSTLVVAGEDAPESVTRRAAARLLIDQARHGTPVQRLDYRTTLRLPSQPRGTFRLTPVE